MPGHSACRICGRPLPDAFFDLGLMPLANSLPTGPETFTTEARYPLAVTRCGSCGLVQLTYVVPAEQLYRDYLYVSSTSEGVRVHADQLAARLVAQYGWTGTDLVGEVGSNDGTVLQAFKRRGLRVAGVDPARKIAALANADGIPTLPEFFDTRTAERLRDRHGAARA